MVKLLCSCRTSSVMFIVATLCSGSVFLTNSATVSTLVACGSPCCSNMLRARAYIRQYSLLLEYVGGRNRHPLESRVRGSHPRQPALQPHLLSVASIHGFVVPHAFLILPPLLLLPTTMIHDFVVLHAFLIKPLLLSEATSVVSIIFQLLHLKARIASGASPFCRLWMSPIQLIIQLA